MGNTFTSDNTNDQTPLNDLPCDIMSLDATRDSNVTGVAPHMGEGPLNRVDYATHMSDATQMGESPQNRVDYLVHTITDLKLEAQKITDVDGSFGNWENWKLSTQCALEGSGYIQVSLSQNFADNPHLSRIVYSQLARETIY